MALYTLVEPRPFHDPVLVLGMEGWIDAGAGAANAVGHALAQHPATVVARWEADEFIDHRARRPVMRIESGVATGLTWPEIELRGGTDAGGRDVLWLIGPEPDLQWRRFAASVVEVAAGFGVTSVFGLGAFPSPVPHTRPVRVVATASSPELASQVGFLPGVIDVPAGIHAVLERSFALSGTPALGLWARVPHYVAAMSYPAASAALLESLARLTGLHLDVTDLHDAGARTVERVNDLVANSPDHQAMMQQLEAQVDSEVLVDGERIDPTVLPSGEELAAELERFLRDHPQP